MAISDNRFCVSQCIFIFFELISWTPNFREGGTLFQKIYETKLFTEWFSPYSTPQLNLFTAVFAISLLICRYRCNESSFFKKTIRLNIFH